VAIFGVGAEAACVGQVSGVIRALATNISRCTFFDQVSALCDTSYSSVKARLRWFVPDQGLGGGWQCRRLAYPAGSANTGSLSGEDRIGNAVHDISCRLSI
jgi:hypothetical protein